MGNIPKKAIDVARRWKTDPKFWVKCTFGDNLKRAFRDYTGKDSLTETGLTIQQEQALEELSKIIRAKLKVYGKQELVGEEIEYAKKIGLSVMSGTGTGKDFFLALVMWYFLAVFKEPRVTATANSAKQLRNILWSQLSRIMDLSIEVDTPQGKMPQLKYLFEYQSEKVFLREKKGETWFAEAVTCSAKQTEKEQAEVLGGRHAKYMLLAADEATGIPDGVFKPLEGTLTGAVNILMLIFNPTRTKGFAIDSQYSDKGRWAALRWNSEDSELVTKESIETMEEKYGRDSAPFRIRVLGLPPLAESDALIPYDWIEEAIDRELLPEVDDYVIGALDCGAGGDKSVFIARKGPKVIAIKENNSSDSNELTDWARDRCLQYEVNTINGDSIGIGWAVVGNLRKLIGGHIVRAIDARGKALEEEKFVNKRAEMHWNMREAFEQKLISIPRDEELIDELGSIRTTTVGNRIGIIRKEKIKADLGHSPDKSDALAMTYTQKFAMNKKIRKQKDPYDRHEETGLTATAKGWMVA